MINDREKLERIKKEVMSKGNSYERMKKENVVDDLLASTDKETGKLSFPFIIPLFEHDGEFLKETLNELGYSPIYEEEYNYFFSTTCYTVNL